MEWFSQNWVWMPFFVGMIAMHMFGHGGHGGHGGGHSGYKPVDKGFFVGLIQSFLYGASAGLVFVPIHNFLHRRWVRQ